MASSFHRDEVKRAGQSDEIDRAETPFEHAVSFASALVGVSDSKSIRSARVVGGRRLTGTELVHLQADARSQGVRLTTDGSGLVAVRRVEEIPEPDALEETISEPAETEEIWAVTTMKAGSRAAADARQND